MPSIWMKISPTIKKKRELAKGQNQLVFLMVIEKGITGNDNEGGYSLSREEREAKKQVNTLYACLEKDHVISLKAF